MQRSLFLILTFPLYDSASFLLCVCVCGLCMDLQIDAGEFPWTKFWNEPCCDHITTRQQHKCIQNTTTLLEQQQNIDSAQMASSSTSKTPIIFTLVAFLLILSSSAAPVSSQSLMPPNSGRRNQTFRPQQELKKLKRIRSYLRKINKPAVKTIQVLFS